MKRRKHIRRRPWKNLALVAAAALVAGMASPDVRAQATCSPTESLNTWDHEIATSISVLFRHEDRIFAGSWDTENVYIHDGATWVVSGTNAPSAGAKPEVSAFCLYDDGGGEAIYATARNTWVTPQGIGAIWKYNGVDGWEVMTTPPPHHTIGYEKPHETTYPIHAIVSYNGKLYCTADRDPMGLPVPIIYEYTPGSGWVEAFRATPGFAPFTRLVVHDDGTGEKLYAGAEQGKIYEFNGATWTFLGGVPFSSGAEEDGPVLISFNGLLYIGARQGVYVYDGASISLAKNLSSSMPGCSFANIQSMTTWAENLYAVYGDGICGGGNFKLFSHSGSDPNASWHATAELASHFAATEVPTMMEGAAVLNDKLYLGTQIRSARFLINERYKAAQVLEIDCLNIDRGPKACFMCD